MVSIKYKASLLKQR